MGWRGAIFALSALFSACHQERVVVPESASFAITAIGGDWQQAPAGSVLPRQLAVQVRDLTGAPVKSARIVFRVVRGGASGSRMIDSVALTGETGVAAASLQLGRALDTTVVTAFPSPNTSRSVTFRATATAAPSLTTVPPSIAPGDTIALRGAGLAIAGLGGYVDFGGTRAAALAVVGDTLVRVVVPACLATGDLAVRVVLGSVQSNAVTTRYTSQQQAVSLAPYEALTIQGARLGSCLLLPSSATYLVVAQFAAVGRADSSITWRLGASGVPNVTTVSTVAPPAVGNVIQRRFEGFLRATEHRIAPAVRAAALARGAVALQGAPSLAPDSLRTFHVVADLTGSTFKDVTARLRYTGSHVLFYVDAEGAGFTDAQYDALGRLFDNDLYGIDAAAFGVESDIDHNGRVVALFTPVVNAMVPAAACGSQGFVTGFFYGVDLLPASPHSNGGEIFYSFIPDSAARYSCQHTASYVQHVLPATFLHELQHLISYSQHVVARGGHEEETWLNEGLSHIAEELGAEYYERRFPAPSGRTSIDQIYPDSAAPFILNDLINAYLYLLNPRAASGTSYVADGSAQERGATWLFLRWLAEQKGEGVLSRLVQTSLTGIGNVEAQSGESFGALFGDFGVAVYADSLVGVSRASVPSRYRFGETSLRRLMERTGVISGFTSGWPLPLFDLKAGGSLVSSMPPGTFSHALSRAKTGASPLALQFSHADLTPFTGTEGAQVSIFRLPP